MSGISQECLGEYPFITCSPRDEAAGFFIELVSGKHGRAVCSTPHHTGSLVTELISLPFWTDIPAAVASLTYSSCESRRWAVIEAADAGGTLIKLDLFIDQYAAVLRDYLTRVQMLDFVV